MLAKDAGKGNLSSNGRERSIQYFRNLAPLTDGELHFRHHAVYHLEERTYGERNQLERTSAK